MAKDKAKSSAGDVAVVEVIVWACLAVAAGGTVYFLMKEPEESVGTFLDQGMEYARGFATAGAVLGSVVGVLWVLLRGGGQNLFGLAVLFNLIIASHWGVRHPEIGGWGLVLVLGLFLCCLGYRFFRLGAPLAGFFVTAPLVAAAGLCLNLGPVATVLCAMGSGLAVAAISAASPVCGVFACGAALAVSALDLVYRAAIVVAASLGGEAAASLARARGTLMLPALVAAGLAGGWVALGRRRPATILSVSFVGALLAATGLAALWKGYDPLLGASAPAAPALFALHTCCTVVLAVAGANLQLHLSKDPLFDVAEGE